jgi:hypothetical protein
MSKDHIDRVAGELWFIFGEYPDGRVDLSDGQDDVFERLPRDVAERIIKLRADFLNAVRAEYEAAQRPAPPPGQCTARKVEAPFAGRRCTLEAGHLGDHDHRSR